MLSFAPMFTLAQMVGLKVPGLSRSRLRKMRVMPLLSSMGTIGKVECWKSEKIDLLGPRAEDLVAVVDLGVVSEEVLVVEVGFEAATLVATADEAGMQVVVATLPLVVTMLAQLLLPQRRILLRIMLHPEERKASSSMFVM